SFLPTHPFSQGLRELCESSVLQPKAIETRRWVKKQGEEGTNGERKKRGTQKH
ncbi:hypothetical protein N320_02708, partial [Buceros rhinoceros silvestris]